MERLTKLGFSTYGSLYDINCIKNYMEEKEVYFALLKEYRADEIGELEYFIFVVIIEEVLYFNRLFKVEYFSEDSDDSEENPHNVIPLLYENNDLKCSEKVIELNYDELYEIESYNTAGMIYINIDQDDIRRLCPDLMNELSPSRNKSARK